MGCVHSKKGSVSIPHPDGIKHNSVKNSCSLLDKVSQKWEEKHILYPPWYLIKCGRIDKYDITPVAYHQGIQEAMKMHWHYDSLREHKEMGNFINKMEECGHATKHWSMYLDGYDNLKYIKVIKIEDQVSKAINSSKKRWKDIQLNASMQYGINFGIATDLGTLIGVDISMKDVRDIIHGSERKAYIDKHLGIGKWIDNSDIEGKNDNYIEYIRNIILALLDGTLLEKNSNFFYTATVISAADSKILNSTVTIYEWQTPDGKPNVYLGARARCIIHDLPIWAIKTGGSNTKSKNIAISYIARIWKNEKNYNTSKQQHS